MRLINQFLQTKTKPEWIIIKYLPVLPANLRPIVKLKDKNVITTDLNLLYSNIISSNSKIQKLRKMFVPESFLNEEKYILQKKVNKLINTEKNNKTKTKSIIDSMKGKRGRFRENLLGKTVDYSARSVIVVEPALQLKECEIPIEISVTYD